MPRPPVKKTYKLAKAEAKGRIAGELEATEKYKNTNKGWWQSLRDHVGKALDRVDPLEATALIATTWLIKTQVIDNSQDIITKVADTVKRTGSAAQAGLSSIFNLATIGIQGPNPLTQSIGEFMNALTGYQKPQQGTVETKPTFTQEDIIKWVLAFVLAYIVVKNGGQLIGLLGDSFSALSKLGVALLA